MNTQVEYLNAGEVSARVQELIIDGAQGIRIDDDTGGTGFFRIEHDRPAREVHLSLWTVAMRDLAGSPMVGQLNNPSYFAFYPDRVRAELALTSMAAPNLHDIFAVALTISPRGE